MADTHNVKLGKRPPRHDPRTLRLERYLLPSLPAPPPTCAWSLMEPDGWGEMLNDQLGCCTIAGLGHAVQTWTEVMNQRITVDDGVVLEKYRDWCGYQGGLGADYDAASDQGGVEIDVLNRWRQQGLDGHALMAYAAVDYSDLMKVKQAIAMFGGVYVGAELPLTANGQDIWTVGSGSDSEPGSWGGHAFWALAYDPAYVTVNSWGKLIKVTWEFWIKYVDEAWALVSPEFATKDGRAPSGFDLAGLAVDLKAVTK